MFKKSFLAVLLVAIGIFALSTAQAAQVDGLANLTGPASPTTIFVNPGGLGDALIYGYYNARGSFNHIRVVNVSTSFGVGAKVRFREGKNSNEVLDFFICLSAGDQWSAWVIDNGNTTEPATLLWYDDDTPTFPDPQGNELVADNFLAGVPLKFSATGAVSSVTADDTKEGYLEIIANLAWVDVPVTRRIKTPTQCSNAVLLGQLPTVAGINDPSALPLDAPNSLMGDMSIFNLVDGEGAYAYNATALASFRATPILGSIAIDSTPRLSDATEGLLAVNYILTKSKEFVIYDVSDLLSGQTTVINTFPTKRLSIELDPGLVGVASAVCPAAGTALPAGGNGPFNDQACIDASGAIVGGTAAQPARCEQIGILVWDDAENTPGATVGFSPSTPVVRSKCDEVSLITVDNASIALLDTNLEQFKADISTFQIGHIDIDLVAGLTLGLPGARTTTVGAMTTTGLPVISYQLNAWLNGFFSDMLPLRYQTTINGIVFP